MNKSRILAGGVFVLLAASSLHAGVVLSEGFDDITTLAASGWTMVNNSAPVGLNGWFQGDPAFFGAQAGPDSSYIAADFNNAGYGGNIDNWLITPVLSMQGYLQLTFFTRTASPQVAADSLQVLLSTNGGSGNGGDFSSLLTINPALDVFGYPLDWTQYTVEFAGTGVAGSTGRFAFRYAVPDTSTNANYIGIDGVSASDVPEPATLGLIAFGLGIAVLGRHLRRADQV